MAETRARSVSWERYVPFTGVLAVALWVMGIIVLETAVEMDDPTTLLDSYRNEEGSILLGGFLWVLGTFFFFFWFLGSLRARLAAAEGGVQRLTALAFAGGVAAAVFGFALPGPDMSNELRHCACLPPGDGHGIFEWPRFHTLAVNGEKFVDWVRGLIAGDPIEDVQCRKCRVG